MTYQFTLHDKVRDYELDIQGVVNNSVYFNYCEHARHEFLLDKGIDFAELAQQHINLVVVEASGKFRAPLRSGDHYWMGVNLEQEGRARIAFVQHLYRSSDDKLVFSARVIGAAMNKRGRPFLPECFTQLFAECQP